MKPQIVLAVTDQEKNSAIAKHKVDMLELRVDLLKKLNADYAVQVIKERRKLRLPILLTIRNQKKEGAKANFSDDTKWRLFQALMPLCTWVDIELSSPILAQSTALARKLKKKVVISAHDFKGMPAHPEILMKKALSLPGRQAGARADMFKIAALAKGPQDLIKMMEFTERHAKQPVVTMCMGPLGGLSRLLLPSVGSRWVFTFLNKPTAPGQIDVKTLKNALRLYHPLVFLKR